MFRYLEDEYIMELRLVKTYFRGESCAMQKHGVVPLDAIEVARARTAATIVRTPLVRFDVPDMPGGVFLKLENLQPVGSFKMRGGSARTNGCALVRAS
jgi:threonine dehydratase